MPENMQWNPYPPEMPPLAAFILPFNTLKSEKNIPRAAGCRPLKAAPRPALQPELKGRRGLFLDVDLNLGLAALPIQPGGEDHLLFRLEQPVPQLVPHLFKVLGVSFPPVFKGQQIIGGYYLDAGCSQLIIDGEVGLLQFDQIERFVEGGALLKDGSVQKADLIVLATGFVAQEVVVAKLLGEAMANKVGPVWGFGADGEMSNMWKRTAQEGLWFVGGSFANCRTYSRYVAVQIKAIEEGLLSKRKPVQV